MLQEMAYKNLVLFVTAVLRWSQYYPMLDNTPYIKAISKNFWLQI